MSALLRALEADRQLASSSIVRTLIIDGDKTEIGNESATQIIYGLGVTVTTHEVD